jgi:hypothetical protein
MPGSPEKRRPDEGEASAESIAAHSRARPRSEVTVWVGERGSSGAIELGARGDDTG